MDLSIIIVSYNTLKITKTCLETVVQSVEKDQSITVEIIVLDNASSDGSVKMLNDFKKSLDKHTQLSMEVIAEEKNVGFGVGNNIAATKASSKYLLFLNSDIEVLDHAIPDILMQFKNHTFDFAGGKLLNKDMSNQPSVGRFYTPFVSFTALFLGADRWGYSRTSPHKVKKVDWVSGACFITTKEKYHALQGFDPEIFMYWEEVDLFYRAHEAGMSVGFFPTARFIHLEGASSKSRTGPILKVYEGYIHFYKKHYSPLNLSMIQYMLKLKALLGMSIGKLFKSKYLTETYTKAYEIAQKN